MNKIPRAFLAALGLVLPLAAVGVAQAATSAHLIHHARHHGHLASLRASHPHKAPHHATVAARPHSHPPV